MSKKIYRCKCHDRAYTVCPKCDCQYCPQYWPKCPRCAEIARTGAFEVARILRSEFGPEDGARYARRIAAANGRDSATYAEAARILSM